MTSCREVAEGTFECAHLMVNLKGIAPAPKPKRATRQAAASEPEAGIAAAEATDASEDAPPKKPAKKRAPRKAAAAVN